MHHWRVLWTVLLIPACVSQVCAQAPLHQQIDLLIEAHPNFQPDVAGNCSDAEFLRRISLDLTGVIPSANRVREFLADESADKRSRVIDELLKTPEHARQMQYVFDVMLMERRPDKHVTAQEWRQYLRQSFYENKPWNQMVSEMLTADGAEEKTRPAAKFLLDRELKVDQVTRDLGRIFLGRDMECAQCHDHPDIEDYLQRHYYGLAAFTKRSYLFKDAKSGKTSIGEKAEGKVEFTSVFTDITDSTPPRLLDLPELPDPPGEKEKYKAKPVKNVRGIPIYSRRLQLAGVMTSDENVAFRVNIANRIWAMMMGQGLVEPLDMAHDSNPPSHPEVLTLLADSLLSQQYDLRFLLRELALTKTHQRSSRYRTEENQTETRDFSAANLKPLTPEQLAWSMMQATGLVEQTLANHKAKKPKESDFERTTALTNALKKDIDALVKVFGVSGIQNRPFDAAADQALFLRNGALLQKWIALEGGLASRLAKQDHQTIPEGLYLAIFSRRPSEAEAKRVTEYLQNQTSLRPAVERLIWAMLVSAEFRFNH